MTLQTALLQGTSILEKADIGVPRLTAEVLLSHAMRCDRSYLYAHGSDELTELAWIHYGRYLNERLKGRPTQYITHRQEFFGRDFFVDERVLIPRPETEHLVEAALAWLATRPSATVLDVGTGSGAIAISLALESRREVLASDLSTDALQVAERNRRTHNAQVSFLACDLLARREAGDRRSAGIKSAVCAGRGRSQHAAGSARMGASRCAVCRRHGIRNLSPPDCTSRDRSCGQGAGC